jgi:hypothetical protein
MNKSFEWGTNVQNYWVFGLCPKSSILKTRKHSISETLCSLVFRIPDDGQSPKTQQSKCYTPSSEPLTI